MNIDLNDTESAMQRIEAAHAEGRDMFWIAISGLNRELEAATGRKPWGCDCATEGEAIKNGCLPDYWDGAKTANEFFNPPIAAPAQPKAPESKTGGEDALNGLDSTRFKYWLVNDRNKPPQQIEVGMEDGANIYFNAVPATTPSQPGEGDARNAARHTLAARVKILRTPGWNFHTLDELAAAVADTFDAAMTATLTAPGADDVR